MKGNYNLAECGKVNLKYTQEAELDETEEASLCFVPIVSFVGGWLVGALQEYTSPMPANSPITNTQLGVGVGMGVGGCYASYLLIKDKVNGSRK